MEPFHSSWLPNQTDPKSAVASPRNDATVAGSSYPFWFGIDGGAVVDWREEQRGRRMVARLARDAATRSVRKMAKEHPRVRLIFTIDIRSNG
jgi:hypothetical protein